MAGRYKYTCIEYTVHISNAETYTASFPCYMENVGACKEYKNWKQIYIVIRSQDEKTQNMTLADYN